MKKLTEYLNESMCGIFEAKVSSTNMEAVICLAHNVHNIDKDESMNDDSLLEGELLNIVGGKLSLTQANLLEEYKANKKIYDDMVECLSNVPVKLKKLPNIKGSVSNDWKGEDNTPKTDIIGIDGSYRISLKNKDTGAQLCSAKYNEAYSTLMVGFDKLSEEDQSIILSLMEADSWANHNQLPMYVSDILKSSDKSLDDWKVILKKNKSDNKDKTKILRDFMKSHPDYAHGVLREAATGTIKFGVGSPSEADLMMSWSLKNPSTSTLENADEYIDDHIKRNMFTYDVNFKSSRGGKFISAYASLRIGIKKG